MRLDRQIQETHPDFSRSRIEGLIKGGFVTVNGAVAEKAGMKVAEDDEIVVEIPPPVPAVPEPEDIPLDVVYEDADIIVINKPRGMVVHPAPGHPDGTLVNALMYHCGDSLSGIGGERRPGIVHRIDKDTSGLIVAAKNDMAHKGLSAQLSDHSLYREYEAVVTGHMRGDSGVIDKPIGRHPVDRKRMAVTEKNSKAAVTHWKLLAEYRGYSHIQCRLETGRTHQIRVHMASIGHPLLGDGLYGAKCPDKGLEGQCLHARRLHLIHPVTGEELRFESALPEYFISVLDKLGTIERKGETE